MSRAELEEALRFMESTQQIRVIALLNALDTIEKHLLDILTECGYPVSSLQCCSFDEEEIPF